VFRAQLHHEQTHYEGEVMNKEVQEKPAAGFEYFLEMFMRHNEEAINDSNESEEFRDSAKAAQLDLMVMKKCYYEEKDKREDSIYLNGLKAGWKMGMGEDTESYAAAVINRGKTYIKEG
jgi:hypothetical protein